MDKTLKPAMVDGRPGYQDGDGMTYALPKASKRVDAWKQRMTAKGWKLEG